MTKLLRETMSESEKRVFQANRKLVEEKQWLEKDIIKLISYIKGNKKIKEEVDNIINYYVSKDRKSKYDEERV